MIEFVINVLSKASITVNLRPANSEVPFGLRLVVNVSKMWILEADTASLAILFSLVLLP